MWSIRVCNIGVGLEKCGVFKGCNFWSLLGRVSNDMAFAHGGSSAYRNIITRLKLVSYEKKKGYIMLEILVECAAGKNSPENVIQSPLFRLGQSWCRRLAS